MVTSRAHPKQLWLYSRWKYRFGYNFFCQVQEVVRVRKLMPGCGRSLLSAEAVLYWLRSSWVWCANSGYQRRR